MPVPPTRLSDHACKEATTVKLCDTDLLPCCWLETQNRLESGALSSSHPCSSGQQPDYMSPSNRARPEKHAASNLCIAHNLAALLMVVGLWASPDLCQRLEIMHQVTWSIFTCSLTITTSVVRIKIVVDPPTYLRLPAALARTPNELLHSKCLVSPHDRSINRWT